MKQTYLSYSVNFFLNNIAIYLRSVLKTLTRPEEGNTVDRVSIGVAEVLVENQVKRV